jgi:RNA polymerase-binding transcription factor DksA
MSVEYVFCEACGQMINLPRRRVVHVLCGVCRRLPRRQVYLLAVW